jgi:threonine/homoserine/homoserine lactone efflux protein
VHALLARRPPPAERLAPPARRLRRLFVQGAVVNVLNPKTAVFFFAFLPQFVKPGAGSPALQLAMLGLLFGAIAVVSDSMWAIAAGAASSWLRVSRGFAQVQRYVSGTILVALGAATALARHR